MLWATGLALILFAGGVTWLVAGNGVLFGLALCVWSVGLLAVLRWAGREDAAPPR